MAIVNRTPDSFYDRGATFTDEAAKTAAHRVIEDGADVVDVGGVKAGPGSSVDVDEEIARVVPFIEWLRDTYPDQLISVDDEIQSRLLKGEAALPAPSNR